jgi:hypothetical protein
MNLTFRVAWIDRLTAGNPLPLSSVPADKARRYLELGGGTDDEEQAKEGS